MSGLLGSLRSTSYRIAHFLGDVQALRRGRIWQRLVNKFLGRKVVNKLWR